METKELIRILKEIRFRIVKEESTYICWAFLTLIGWDDGEMVPGEEYMQDHHPEFYNWILKIGKREALKEDRFYTWCRSWQPYIEKEREEHRRTQCYNVHQREFRIKEIDIFIKELEVKT